MPEYLLKEVMKQGFVERKCIFLLLISSAHIAVRSISNSKPRLAHGFIRYVLHYISFSISTSWIVGRDMIGISATGSGKTLAFLLPAMIHINAQVIYTLQVLLCCICSVSGNLWKSMGEINPTNCCHLSDEISHS